MLVLVTVVQSNDLTLQIVYLLVSVDFGKVASIAFASGAPGPCVANDVQVCN